MRLIVVTNKKETNIQDHIFEEHYERHDWKDFLGRLNRREYFITEKDFVLCAFRDKALLDHLEKRITKVGVSAKQIVNISEWDGIEIDEMKRIEKCIYSTGHCDGILIGMSHLKDGIVLNRMQGTYIMIGIPSIDIFYINKIVRLMIDHNRLDGVKQIIFEFPYYMFNWDISRSVKMVERFHIAYYFGDYHHFGEDPHSQAQLSHMLLYNNVMKRKMLQIGKGLERYSKVDRHREQSRSDFIKSMSQSVLSSVCEMSEQRNLCKKEYAIWSKLHWDTIKENQNEWNDMIEMLTKEHPSLKIGIAIFPHHPYFRTCHHDEIVRMRSIFYGSIECGKKIKMIDLFDHHLPFWCFSDECHLNEFGAYMFSKVFDTTLGV